ncbi:MAG: helix-turn-helix transcriptional regulator [Clostridiales bacterium]|nr:helix-turn-helix transcriptional regulator [Clostridiales bacterium]
MALSYNKLWKLLIDRGMTKTELRTNAKISSNALAKMGKGGDVSTQVLDRICQYLDCELEDIAEVIPNEFVKKDS